MSMFAVGKSIIGMVMLVVVSDAFAQPLSEDVKYTLGDLGGPADNYGQQIELTEDYLIISSKDGGDGEIWVYDRTDHGVVRRITSPDQYNAGLFGLNVSVAGDVLVTSSFDRDDQGERVVIVYVIDLVTFEFIAHFQTESPRSPFSDQRILRLATNGYQIAVLVSDSGGYSRNYSVMVHDIATGSEIWNFYERIDSPAGDSAELTGPILMNDDLLVVGMPGTDTNSLQQGRVFVYDLHTGETVYELTPSRADAFGLYGASMSMLGNQLLVAAPFAATPTTPDTIGVVYSVDLANGEEQFVLSQPEWDTVWRGEMGFGEDVGVNEEYIIVGSPVANGVGTGTGLTYLFDRETGAFIATLYASDGLLSDFFGYEVAVYGDEAFVTAIGDDDDGSLSGSVYRYTGLPCARVDLATPRHLIDMNDVSAFLDLWVADDLYVDFNNDGMLNFFDVASFLAAYNAGCP